MNKVFQNLIFIILLPVVFAGCSGKQIEYYRNTTQRGDSVIGRYRINPAMAKKVNCFRFLYDKGVVMIESLRAGKIHNSWPFSMMAKTVVEDLTDGKKHIYKDICDEPADNGYGIYYHTSINEGNNQILSTNYNQFGIATEDFYGIAQTLATLDQKGRISKAVGFDKDYKRIINKQGEPYEIRYHYDNDDNVIESFCYNQNNILLNDKDGIAIYRVKYNKYGYVMESSCYGADGALKDSDRTGVAIARYKYDDQGNFVEISSYGISEQLQNGKNGYAISRVKYNEKGDCVEISCYGTDEKPKEGKNGIAANRYKYNEKGAITESSCYGADGALKDSLQGVAITRIKYNNQGNRIEMSYYGTDEKPKEDNTGVATYRFKYNEKDNTVETSFYGVNDELKETKNGVAAVLYKYNGYTKSFGAIIKTYTLKECLDSGIKTKLSVRSPGLAKTLIFLVIALAGILLLFVVILIVRKTDKAVMPKGRAVARSIFCTQCGKENSSNASFCVHCGHKLK